MSRSRVVSPDTAVLKISDGDTLTVRRRLNEGEHRAMLARQYREDANGLLKTNLFQFGNAEVLAYLIDWSLVDSAGKVLRIRDQSVETVASILDSLDPDDVREIREAVSAHVEAMDQERVAAKKVQGGGSKSPAISPSPDGVEAGATSGSAS